MKKLLVYLSVLVIFLFSGCGKTESTLNEKGKVDYTTFLSGLYDNKSSDEELYFSIRDLDNNGIPELVIARNGANITVYTYNDTVVEIGNHDFVTGTTRLFCSDNPLYPGIFFYFAGGGLDHYGYLTIKDNKLMYEELWNEDYSGVSKELGISREKIEELSADKQIINESRKVYKENNDLPFQKLQIYN
ncbi:MAG TPA: hypothetical protein PK566_04130 [Pseudobacteroides sp.]|nr:hypothetical protein [Pseudobacteroides sp.]